MTDTNWTPYIEPGTGITCQLCEGHGRVPWFNWLCGWCNGTGKQVHWPNSTTTTITLNTEAQP